MYHQMRMTAEKLTRRLARIQQLDFRRRVELQPFKCRILPNPEKQELNSTDEWEVIQPGDYWAKKNMNFILRSHIRFPDTWDKAIPAGIFLPIGIAGDFSHPEALVYIDGKPLASCDRHHQEIILPGDYKDGHRHELILHGWTGTQGLRESPSTQSLQMQACELVQIDLATRQFLRLAQITLETAKQLHSGDPVVGNLLNILDKAFLRLDLREPITENFYETVPGALDLLQEGVNQSGSALRIDLHAVGHAHIDVAWLWTLSQTRQKAARTFYTANHYMNQYPDYRFTQSQPQLYEFIRQDDPDLFNQIRKRVTDGRWELTGGMWVEADCNLSGSEALARQFILGRQYFADHFGPGKDSPILWLPDVFGYAWALPQLIKLAGLEYFMTIKIGWNQYNRMPYDTFWWQGIDGTKILTHFSTTPEPGSQYASTYNAKADATAVLGTWQNFKQKELQNDLLMAYGYGDGGGGPTRQMIENISIMQDFPGLPRVKFSSARAFFEELAENLDKRTPTWNGELYLEYHRGTYTTQSRNKRANRKAEFALHDLEFLSVLAHLVAGAEYPQAKLTELWRLLCLNQFHDIIPGSSIREVYEDSLIQYDELMTCATRLTEKALEKLAGNTGNNFLLVNPSPFPFTQLVEFEGNFPSGHSIAQNGTSLPLQSVKEGLLVAAVDAPPYSLSTMVVSSQPPPVVEKPVKIIDSGGEITLENQYILATFSAEGDLTRLFDKKADREVLAPGQSGNQFQAFEDRPLNWDAWDIDIFYDDKVWFPEPAKSIEIVEEGPLRAAIKITRRILNSDYTQNISLSHDNPILTFKTSINWQERHVLLKCAFPVNILSPHATYEIQWGSVQRPTHRNTSWDWARFETCAHKWVDLSEGDYGISLLNDCKYGHDIHENIIRLTLLRSPSTPDPQADLGNHAFTYQLFPHRGPLNEQTSAAAYALNDPAFMYIPKHISTGNIEKTGISLFSVEQTNVVIETIKAAEDGNGVILRLYENQRYRGIVTLKSHFPILQAFETNLLEENLEEIQPHGHQLEFQMRPFQILTLRLVFANESTEKSS